MYLITAGTAVIDCTLYCGSGRDFGWGGEKSDLMYGETENDTLLGELGNDTIIGGLGSNLPIGEASDRDFISGNTGDDFSVRQ